MKLTNRKDRDDKSATTTLWLGDAYDGPSVKAYRSWSHRYVGCELTIGGESQDLTLTFGLGFFVVLSAQFLPWSFRSRTYEWSKRRAEANKARGIGSTWAHELDPMDGRQTGLRIHSGSVWWNIWHNDTCWASEDRKVWPWESNGWSGAWHVWDWVVGKPEYHEEPGTWHDAAEDIDGVRYPFRVHLYHCRVSRRWPWAGCWLHRYTISLQGQDHHDPQYGKVPAHSPPMRAGKGENSYDCGPDGTYLMTGAASPVPYSVAEVVEEYVKRFRRDEERYGKAG